MCVQKTPGDTCKIGFDEAEPAGHTPKARIFPELRSQIELDVAALPRPMLSDAGSALKGIFGIGRTTRLDASTRVSGIIPETWRLLTFVKSRN